MMSRRRTAAAAGSLARAAALSLVLLTAIAPAAPAFLRGDVLVSVPDGTVQQFAPDGEFVASLVTGSDYETLGSAFDGAGRLYVAGYLADSVFAFSPDGAPLGQIGGPYSSPTAITFDAAESFYVAQGVAGGELLKLDATGTPLATHSLELDAGGVLGIDLAADQCTLYYASTGRQIKRFDVCAGAQLPDFALLPDGTATAVRLLADGGALVAAGVAIHRLGPTGTIVQTYDAPAAETWTALALDPDGPAFWGADQVTGTVARFELATADVVSSFNATAGFASVYGLSVAGEPRAAKRLALALTPASAESPTGETATVTAHLTESGSDEANASIIFTVSGSHADFAVHAADETGRATFSYTGDEAGTDTITACADVDGISGCGPGEPTATATRNRGQPSACHRRRHQRLRRPLTRLRRPFRRRLRRRSS